MADYIGALDQGTTSTRFIVFDRDGRIVSADQREHAQIHPRAGWVEHDPNEILARTREVIEAATGDRSLAAIGITNQRETTIVWDRETGEPVYNAIVWQDTRTDELVRGYGDADQLRAPRAPPRARGHGARAPARPRPPPPLPLSTYFSGPKIAWILEHVDGARE